MPGILTLSDCRPLSECYGLGNRKKKDFLAEYTYLLKVMMNYEVFSEREKKMCD